MPLSIAREQEITALAERYGSPERVVIELPCNTFDPLIKTDRIGEVCMVVRRPDGRLILARKTFYPPQGYRLLTGGIAHDEPIEDALLRETWEETGLDVVVRRFLAVLDYRPVDDSSPETETDPEIDFYTFAFLLDEVGGVLEPQDEHERLDSFSFVLPEELPTVAETLEQIGNDYDPVIAGRWRDWGIFRAAVHRVVHQTIVALIEL